MQSSTIRYQSSSIHYQWFGEGSKVLICFAGYGEDGGMYSFLEKYIEHEEMTVILMDLPFHGKTAWREGLLFSVMDLTAVMLAVLLEQGKEKMTDVTVIGFSLGARVALQLYETGHLPVKKLILLAPDGLKVNGWYWLATQTWMGNRFFAYTMKKPGWFVGILKQMNKWGLVNSSIFKFVQHYIADPVVRGQLYQRWTTFRKLRPAIGLIQLMVRQRGTKVTMIYGTHDRIILSSVGERFNRGLGGNGKLVMVPGGHQVLHEKYVDAIMSAIKD